MKFPIIIASGQGILPFVMFGIPAAIIGFSLLIWAMVLVLKKKKESDTAIVVLSCVGVLLIAFILVAPKFESQAYWVLSLFRPQP